MPIYEYDCAGCGDFALLRPMAERDQPCQCPTCGGLAVRVILSAGSGHHGRQPAARQ